MLYFSALAMSFAIGLNTLIVIHVVIVPAFQCTICLSGLVFWCVTHPISPSSAGTGVISLSLSLSPVQHHEWGQYTYELVYILRQTGPGLRTWLSIGMCSANAPGEP